MRLPTAVSLCAALTTLILFVNCGTSSPSPPPPDFRFSADPAMLSVTVGDTSPPAVISVEAINGFITPVSVTIAGLPDGVTSFPAFPLTLTPGTVQEVTFSTPSSLQIGSIPLQYTATAGGLSKSGTMALNVTPVPVIRTGQDGSMDFLQAVTGNETVRVGSLPGEQASLSLV